MFAIIGIVIVFGAVIGGFLMDALSWRAAFWVNLPLAAIALWLTVRFVPESRDDSASGRRSRCGGPLCAATGADAAAPASDGLDAA